MMTSSNRSTTPRKYREISFRFTGSRFSTSRVLVWQSITKLRSLRGASCSLTNLVGIYWRCLLVVKSLLFGAGSVFSLLSAADRDRLRKVAGTTVASNDTKTPPTAGHTHRPHPQTPPTTEHTLPPTSSPSVPVAPTPLAQKPSSLGDNSIESKRRVSKVHNLNLLCLCAPGIKPYARNPLKQARYEAFLTGRRPHTGQHYVQLTFCNHNIIMYK